MTVALFVAPSARPGGAERALAGVVRHLPQHGIEPVVALLERGTLEQWLDAAECAWTTVDSGRLRQMLRRRAAVTELAELAAERGASVVVSSMAKGHLYAGVAAKRLGLPVVWWQHTIPGSRIDRVAARVPAAAVVCGSDAAVDAQRRITPRSRVVKVHPGTAVSDVAARRGSGARLRQQLGWDGARIVGVVGRLQAWKGQDVFLRAAALLARDDPGVRFAVVGGAILGLEGSYPRDLHALAAELGIADRVHFAGHQEDVYPWLDALDVIVHSSLAEPFGLVIVEAMALGKPVVATNVAGPTEIVEDGVSGLLVPPGDPERLAHAVRRVLDDPELGERLGHNAASRAAHFTDERAAAAFAAVIESVLGGAAVS